MRNRRTLLAFALLALGADVSAGSGSYRIVRATISGGGATLDGGAFHVDGTLGQTATESLAGSTYRLYDGFWAPVSGSISDLIFANGFDP